MTPYFLSLARLSLIVTLLAAVIFHRNDGGAITIVNFINISLTTLLLSLVFLDTNSVSSIIRLNVGSYTVSLRREIPKPLILYDNEWNVWGLRARECLSSLGIPTLIYPIPKMTTNFDYFYHFPIESRFLADVIALHPLLQLQLPLLYDPNTGAVLYGEGWHIMHYIYGQYSKRLTDADPPPPLTMGPLDAGTASIVSYIRRMNHFGECARPSLYNRQPLHLYGNQADFGSRTIREWLCRLQLHYILFPTSRGSLHRAVFFFQADIFFHSRRTHLLYQRFHLLVAFEHEKALLMEHLQHHPLPFDDADDADDDESDDDNHNDKIIGRKVKKENRKLTSKKHDLIPNLIQNKSSSLSTKPDYDISDVVFDETSEDKHSLTPFSDSVFPPTVVITDPNTPKTTVITAPNKMELYSTSDVSHTLNKYNVFNRPLINELDDPKKTRLNQRYAPNTAQISQTGTVQLGNTLTFRGLPLQPIKWQVDLIRKRQQKQLEERKLENFTKMKNDLAVLQQQQTDFANAGASSLEARLLQDTKFGPWQSQSRQQTHAQGEKSELIPTTTSPVILTTNSSDYSFLHNMAQQSSATITVPKATKIQQTSPSTHVSTSLSTVPTSGTITDQMSSVAVNNNDNNVITTTLDSLLSDSSSLDGDDLNEVIVIGNENNKNGQSQSHGRTTTTTTTTTSTTLHTNSINQPIVDKLPSPHVHFSSQTKIGNNSNNNNNNSNNTATTITTATDNNTTQNNNNKRKINNTNQRQKKDKEQFLRKNQSKFLENSYDDNDIDDDSENSEDSSFCTILKNMWTILTTSDVTDNINFAGLQENEYLRRYILKKQQRYLHQFDNIPSPPCETIPLEVALSQTDNISNAAQYSGLYPTKEISYPHHHHHHHRHHYHNQNDNSNSNSATQSTPNTIRLSELTVSSNISATTSRHSQSQVSENEINENVSNIDERLLNTSISSFHRNMGLCMLYDPNTDITAFGEEAVIQYLRTMYELHVEKFSYYNNFNKPKLHR